MSNPNADKWLKRYKTGAKALRLVRQLAGLKITHLSVRGNVTLIIPRQMWADLMTVANKDNNND